MMFPCPIRSSFLHSALRRAFLSSLLVLGLLVPLAAFEEEAPLVGELKQLKQLSDDLAAMAGPAGEATVALISRGGRGAGSGVVVSEDGLILTAAHVVAALSEEIIVLFPDGSRADAKPLGGDFDRDAAMVQITEKGSYPHVEVFRGDELKRNQWCVALGHPGGFDPARTPPIRLGRLLSENQFLISDSAVVSGDSGGPLFDIEGRVIGIHSNIGASLSQNRHVPISVYLDEWESMKAGERSGSRFAARQQIDPDRAVLGVQLGEPAEGGGVLVESTLEGSPARELGLAAGDAVMAVNDTFVENREELIAAVNEFKPGDEIELSYLRDGTLTKASVKLARLGDLLERRGRPAPDAVPDEAESEEEDAEKENAPAEEKEEGEEGDALDRFLDESLDLENGRMELELTPEKIEQFGGMDRIQERLQERMREMFGADNDGSGEEAGDDEAQAEARDEVRKKLEDALAQGTMPEIDFADIRKAGGIENLQEMLREMIEGLEPETREKLRSSVQESMMVSDKFFASTMKVLQPLVKRVGKSTVAVLLDDKPVALGTVVSKDGWILTKDSETGKGEIIVSNGDKRQPARLVKRFPKHGLALFQVEDTEGLVPVRWVKRGNLPELGELLTASSPAGEPLGIGLVSVKERALGNVGYLGVQMADEEERVVLQRVLPGSAAAKAGLKKGDVVTSIDGKKARDSAEFGSLVRKFKVGDKVALKIARGEESKEFKVQLGERPTQSAPPGPEAMQGRLSERTGGFSRVLQHDIPLDPRECGGPLLDLDGRCVGINNSRAGRVKTYAVPAGDVRKLLASVNESEETPSEMESAPGISPEELAEVRKLLEEVREDLKAVEMLLEKVAE